MFAKHKTLLFSTVNRLTISIIICLVKKKKYM